MPAKPQDDDPAVSEQPIADHLTEWRRVQVGLEVVFASFCGMLLSQALLVIIAMSTFLALFYTSLLGDELIQWLRIPWLVDALLPLLFFLVVCSSFVFFGMFFFGIGCCYAVPSGTSAKRLAVRSRRLLLAGIVINLGIVTFAGDTGNPGSNAGSGLQIACVRLLSDSLMITSMIVFARFCQRIVSQLGAGEAVATRWIIPILGVSGGIGVACRFFGGLLHENLGPGFYSVTLAVGCLYMLLGVLVFARTIRRTRGLVAERLLLSSLNVEG